jgi:plastocyanin
MAIRLRRYVEPCYAAKCNAQPVGEKTADLVGQGGIAAVAYSPAKVSAHVGDTIEWSNKDIVDHSATAKNKEWDVALPAHGTGHVVVKKAGHFDYYCKYHPTMTGEIEVSP